MRRSPAMSPLQLRRQRRQSPRQFANMRPSLWFNFLRVAEDCKMDLNLLSIDVPGDRGMKIWLICCSIRRGASGDHSEEGLRLTPISDDMVGGFSVISFGKQTFWEIFQRPLCSLCEGGRACFWGGVTVGLDIYVSRKYVSLYHYWFLSWSLNFRIDKNPSNITMMRYVIRS